MAKIITLISSTAGVGKTHFGVNFAYRLTSLGHRTCLFNADADATHVNGLLSIDPKSSLEDLIKNRHLVDHIIHRSPTGIDFFPGTPGLEQISGLKSNQQHRLIRSIQELNAYDYFILDTFPGLSKNVVAFCKAASTVILVMTPEPSALTNAYVFLKLLSSNGFAGTLMVLINKCKNVKTARSAYLKFKEAVGTYLPLNIQPLGSIFSDPNVELADEAKKPFLTLYPETDAAKCVNNIVRLIVDKRIADVAVSAFWTRFLEEMKRPYQLAFERPMKILREASQENIEPNDTPVEAHDSIPEPFSKENQSEESESETIITPEINSQFNQLMEQISTLSQDIEEMKNRTQDRNESITHPDSASSPNDRDSMIQIPLDFDAYVKRRESGS